MTTLDELADKPVWEPRDVALFLQVRQENDNDFTTVLTGNKGAGKSTLAYEIAEEVNPLDFSLENNFLLSPDGMEIAEQMDAMTARRAVVLDEAIGSLYTENWSSPDQKGLHVYLNQFQRKDRQTVLLLCIPSIWDLRGPLLRSSVDAWIHLYARGEGALMIKTPMPIEDVFMRDRLRRRWEELAGSEGVRTNVLAQHLPGFQKKVYRGMPTFLKTIRFPELPKPKYDAYMEYVRLNREKIRSAIFAAAEAEKVKREKRRIYVEKHNSGDSDEE